MKEHMKPVVMISHDALENNVWHNSTTTVMALDQYPAEEHKIVFVGMFTHPFFGLLLTHYFPLSGQFYIDPYQYEPWIITITQH